MVVEERLLGGVQRRGHAEPAVEVRGVHLAHHAERRHTGREPLPHLHGVEAAGVVPLVGEDAEAPALGDLQELNAWLKEVWIACLGCHESEARIADARSHLDALEESLAKLERLNVDLAHLLRPDSLLAVNIGSLPAAGFKRVTEALSMTGHLVSRFDQAGEQVFAVIAGPRVRQDEIRGLLAQAGWRERRATSST